MQILLGEPLEVYRARSLATMNAEAETIRARFVTAQPAQMSVYAEKEREARALLAAWPVDDFGSFMHLLLEAQATARAPDALAREIIATADAWRLTSARIEAARRAASIAIQAATTHAQIAAALKVDWAAVLAG